MKKFFPIALALAAFIIAGSAPARARTIHHRVPHDLRLLHMQEAPHCACRRALAIWPGRTTGAPSQTALVDWQKRWSRSARSATGGLADRSPLLFSAWKNDLAASIAVPVGHM